jgi:tRNA(His) 5'-end guanylyltransferase
MNAAAQAVMRELTDLVIAYGNSDEYRYASPPLRNGKRV